jgi:uncharacterized protein with GYD domain
MAHFLFRASYTQQGLEGVLKEGGAARAAAVTELIQSLGGSVEALYWAFGADDFILIAELPDNATAAAMATRVTISGVANVSTTVLITPDEFDAAAKVTVSYRPPAG